MILPTKHLSINESLLGSGAIVLKELTQPQTVSRLWDRVRTNPVIGNFGRFTLTLTFLYSINAIDSKDHLIKRKGRT
jgi:hypothetical protein